MTARSFDLTTEPWIPVRTLDQQLRQLSLREVFAQAASIAGLAGELPTTDAALLRLLLAILGDTIATDDTLPERSVDRWQQLWDSGTLPLAAIDAYLEGHRARFDLLHPTQPFLQVADLHTTKGTVSSLLPLIADVPNGFQFFTTRSGPGTRSVGYAEAARWLVHCQAYDASGIKSGAVGDPTVKGGKGYPIGTSWAGQLGLVVLEGTSLRDSLLLNLPLEGRNGDDLLADGAPIWTDPPLTAARRQGAPERPSMLELLTWPSRRVRLVADGDEVTGVLICNGDPLPARDKFAEPMTAWRRSKNQEKLLKTSPVYLPAAHQPDRALWRGLSSLLPLLPGHAADMVDRLEPLSLRWLQALRLTAGGGLPDDYPLRTRAVGLVYGSNSSVVAELIDDTLLMHAVLLGERGADLRQAALNAVAAADETARAVGSLAGNLTLAAGGGRDTASGARDLGRSRYYLAVDVAFRSWLAAIVPGADPHDVSVTWQRGARVTAGAIAAELLVETGPAAWRGRVVNDLRGPQLYDAGLAARWFDTALAKALPLARIAPVPSDPSENLQEATA